MSTVGFSQDNAKRKAQGLSLQGLNMKIQLFALSALLASICCAEPNKEKYELAERCGKLARASFEREWGEGMANNERGQTLTSYQNHYNAKLNKCFYLQQVQYYPKNKNDSSSEERLLYDINENREYGMFRVMANYGRLFDRAAPTDCYVLDKRCSSDREWETLIKPYMEE